MVAEGCNLKCDYCFEGYKQPAFMDSNTATDAIGYYLAQDAGYDEVMIDFMGGEPMLAFPLIKRIVEHVTSRKQSKNYGFCMSTNGTLFNEENRAWFKKYKKIITPMLSFDGTKIAHDMNRSKSFDQVEANIAFLKESWPLQGFKMTVNNRSLPHLADGVFSVLARGCILDLNLVHEDVWGKGREKRKHLRILEYELARLVDFYTEFPTLEPPNLVSLPIIKCITQDTDHSAPWCGAGDAMVAVDRNGVKYPCHRFMNFSAGKSMTLREYESREKKLQENPQCSQCAMKPACPTCQGCNWQYTGGLANRVTYNCEMLKLQMVATAAIHLNRIKIKFHESKPPEIEAHELAMMGRTLDAVRFTFTTLAAVPKDELLPYITGVWPGGKNWERRVRWNASRKK